MGKSKSGKEKRDPLLPRGCKDLIDVIRRQRRQSTAEPPPPQIHAWVFLPERVTVRYLALLTGKDVHSVSTHMKKLGIHFSMERGVDFAGAKRLLLLYGIQAEPREA